MEMTADLMSEFLAWKENRIAVKGYMVESYTRKRREKKVEKPVEIKSLSPFEVIGLSTWRIPVGKDFLTWQDQEDGSTNISLDFKKTGGKGISLWKSVLKKIPNREYNIPCNRHQIKSFSSLQEKRAIWTECRKYA